MTQGSAALRPGLSNLAPLGLPCSIVGQKPDTKSRFLYFSGSQAEEGPNMTDKSAPGKLTGSADLRLPDALREPLRAHLRDLHERYRQRHWGERVGFGNKPAVVVIDLARFWLDPGQQIGSHLDCVVEATCRVLQGARAARVPIFFTSFAYDPAEPPSPHDRKLQFQLPADAA